MAAHVGSQEPVQLYRKRFITSLQHLPYLGQNAQGQIWSKVYNRHSVLKKQHLASDGITIMDEKGGRQDTSTCTWQLTCLKVHPKLWSLITPKHHCLPLSIPIGGFSVFFQTPKNCTFWQKSCHLAFTSSMKLPFSLSKILWSSSITYEIFRIPIQTCECINWEEEIGILTSVCGFNHAQSITTYMSNVLETRICFYNLLVSVILARYLNRWMLFWLEIPNPVDERHPGGLDFFF